GADFLNCGNVRVRRLLVGPRTVYPRRVHGGAAQCNGGAAMNASGRSRTAAGVSEALSLLDAGNSRLVSIFGSIDGNGARRVHYIIDVDNREYRQFSAAVEGAIPSATRTTAAAAWY